MSRNPVHFGLPPAIVRAVSSVFAQIELFRAVGRASIAGSRRLDARQRRRIRQQADAALSRINLLALDERIVTSAESMQPFSLQSLDAIHLATALSVRPIESFVAYDHRLSEAAITHGLTVVAPGQ